MTNKFSQLSPIIIAIEDLDADKNKQEVQQNESIIQNYINSTKLRANLLHGNYEAALRMTAPVFAERKGQLSEIPHLGIIISLLARLKKARGENRLNTFKYPDISMQELNGFVDSLINKGDCSPNSAISFLGENTGSKVIALRGISKI